MVWSGTPGSQNRLRCAPGRSWVLLGAPGRSGGILGAAGWFLDAPWALLGGCGSTVAPTFFFIVFPFVFLLLFDLRLLISSLLFYLIFGFSLCFLLLLSFSLGSLCGSLSFVRPGTHHSPTAPQGGGSPRPSRPYHGGWGGDGAAAHHIFLINPRAQGYFR